MRKKGGEELKIGIISSLSATIIWVSLGSLWSLVAANIISILNSQIIATWQYFIAGISIGVSSILSFMFFKEKSNKFKPKFPSLSMDYIYNQIEAELCFKTREELFYRANYTVQALKEIVSMERSHYWSGSKISDLPIIKSTENHKVEAHKDGEKKKVNIIFEEPLQKNQVTSFELKYELGDPAKIMKPFLGHLVRNPTENITLRLCVPQGMVHRVKKCIYADTAGVISLSQPVKMLPRVIGYNDVYEWKIENASLLYYYEISWEFADSCNQ